MYFKHNLPRNLLQLIDGKYNLTSWECNDVAAYVLKTRIFKLVCWINIILVFRDNVYTAMLNT